MKKPLSADNMVELTNSTATNIVKALKNDTAPKNNSSIVFIAGAEGTTLKDQKLRSRMYQVAMTGDGIATHSFLPIFNQKKGKPLRIDVLKVMHHGSVFNNCRFQTPQSVSIQIQALASCPV